MVHFANIGLLSMSIFLIVSCSGNSNKPADKKDAAGTNVKPATGKDGANMEVVATDICDCVSNYESELSDDGKAKIMNADRNSEVDTTWKTLGPKDLEVYNTEGKKAMLCISGLFQKHPFLQKLDKNTSRQMSGVLKEHCSEFAAALVAPGN